MKHFQTKMLLAASAFTFASLSHAAVYEFEDNSANNGGFGDRLETISSTYNSDSERFTWDVTFNATGAADVDGFWLVVNNGPNPKAADVNELAIMYGDLSTQTLSTYVYNGQNNANSINTPGILLQTDSFSVSSDSFSIDIDATAINAWAGGSYTGISYDENIGIWFHVATGSQFTYDENGNITDFAFAQQGWFDKAHLKTTTQVSESGVFALLGLGLMGLASMRKRKA